MLPPAMVTPGNSVAPSGLRRSDRARAVLASVMYTALAVGRLVASASAQRAAMSARTPSASVPLDGIGVTPFVIDAGLAEAPVPTALSGSTKSTSIRSITASARSSRTRVWIAGSENRDSSSVTTEIAAIFAQVRVCAS
ncbi:hypothetical protein D3C81_1605250 [compost metagenome]